jgi:hypothetical protein
MPTSSEDMVKLDANATQAPRHSHHRSRQRKRLAARVVLFLALVIGGLAVCDFAYNAYMRTDCMTEADTDAWGITTPAQAKSGPCDAEVAGRDDRLRLDAAVTLVAAALLTGSILASRRLKPHRR